MRLSAIGDICHTLPVVRTIQHAWPQTRITWIIGRVEASLVGDIPDIEFIIYDKTEGRTGRRKLQRALRGRRFDIYLQMQVSLRSSIAGLAVNAPRHIGFDRARAHDFQWLFTNERIAPGECEHVMDGLFGFAEQLGIHERRIEWNIPISENTQAFARQHIPDKTPTLIISPLANPRLLNWRNWRLDRYAAVADFAARRGLAVIMTGGSSEADYQAGEAIMSLCQSVPRNLIGKTTLKQLLALIARAEAIVTPDSGPAHMATTVNTPAIGLYATTNPNRSGAYFSRAWRINHYPDALSRFNHTSVEKVRWGARVRHPEAMGLIQVDEVTAMIDRLVTSQHNRSRE